MTYNIILGNAHSDSSRDIAVGFDSGDLKIFDLRVAALRWSTKVANGVSTQKSCYNSAGKTRIYNGLTSQDMQHPV